MCRHASRVSFATFAKHFHESALQFLHTMSVYPQVQIARRLRKANASASSRRSTDFQDEFEYVQPFHAPAAARSANGDATLSPAPTSAGLDSAAFASAFGLSLSAVQLLWAEFTRRVRTAWEDGEELPHFADTSAASSTSPATVPETPAPITLSAGLVHQKLELINQCIRTQRQLRLLHDADKEAKMATAKSVPSTKVQSVSSRESVAVPPAVSPPNTHSSSSQSASSLITATSSKVAPDGAVSTSPMLSMHTRAPISAVSAAASDEFFAEFLTLLS